MKTTQVTDKHIEIIPEVFIENVRKVLDFHGLKMKDLTNLTGLSAPTISKLLSEDPETRMKEPPLQTVARVCLALNMNMTIAVLKRVNNVMYLFNRHIANAEMNEENRECFIRADQMARDFFEIKEIEVQTDDIEGDYNFNSVRMQLFDIHVYARDVLGKNEIALQEAVNFMREMKVA